jgi:hypothetical protein
LGANLQFYRDIDNKKAAEEAKKPARMMKPPRSWREGFLIPLGERG